MRMDSWQLLVSVLIGLFTGLLISFFWNRRNSKKQFGISNTLKLAIPQPSEIGPIDDEHLDTPSTATAKKTESAETGKEINDEQPELTMKERFYLFLEKGFCPELEKGIEDPMYKYLGGANQESSQLNGNTAEDLFCPFGGSKNMQESEEDDTDGETLDRKAEINTLEKLIKLGMSNGGQCPFNMSSVNKTSTVDAGESLQTSHTIASSVDCPFNFALEPGADSEDEADVPLQHKKRGIQCPRSTTAANQLTTTATNQEEMETLSQAKECSSTNMKHKLQETLQTVKESLSEKELEEEFKMREKQMAAITRLLEGEQEGSIELHSQLKLYI